MTDTEDNQALSRGTGIYAQVGPYGFTLGGNERGPSFGVFQEVSGGVAAYVGTEITVVFGQGLLGLIDIDVSTFTGMGFATPLGTPFVDMGAYYDPITKTQSINAGVAIPAPMPILSAGVYSYTNELRTKQNIADDWEVTFGSEFRPLNTLAERERLEKAGELGDTGDGPEGKVYDINRDKQ